MSTALSISRQGTVVVVEPGITYEAADSAAMERVRDELLAEVDRADPPLMLFDMHRTLYFGSTFVGVLFETWVRLRTRKGRLAFCNLNGDVQRVLDVVRLRTVCPFYESRDEAVAALDREHQQV